MPNVRYAEQKGVRYGKAMNSALGEKIKKLRKGKGLTLDKLAELADSSKSYVWELENKTPPRPSADKLSKIADALDTTLEFLLDSSGNIPEEDAADATFYRNYRKLDASTKSKIRKIVDLWDDED